MVAGIVAIIFSAFRIVPGTQWTFSKHINPGGLN